MKGTIMLPKNNSVTDAINMMRDRADIAQTSLKNATKRRMSIRTKQILTGIGTVTVMAGALVAAAAYVQNTSKEEYFEDEV